MKGDHFGWGLGPSLSATSLSQATDARLRQAHDYYLVHLDARWNQQILVITLLKTGRVSVPALLTMPLGLKSIAPSSRSLRGLLKPFSLARVFQVSSPWLVGRQYFLRPWVAPVP